MHCSKFGTFFDIFCMKENVKFCKMTLNKNTNWIIRYILECRHAYIYIYIYICACVRPECISLQLEYEFGKLSHTPAYICQKMSGKPRLWPYKVCTLHSLDVYTALFSVYQNSSRSHYRWRHQRWHRRGGCRGVNIVAQAMHLQGGHGFTPHTPPF